MDITSLCIVVTYTNAEFKICSSINQKNSQSSNFSFLFYFFIYIKEKVFPLQMNYLASSYRRRSARKIPLQSEITNFKFSSSSSLKRSRRFSSSNSHLSFLLFPRKKQTFLLKFYFAPGVGIVAMSKYFSPLYIICHPFEFVPPYLYVIIYRS